mgnify:CR=1 FL=1
MKGTWEITPGGIAALVYVRTPETTGESQCAVYLSKARGVVIGRHDTPLSESGWPEEVCESIDRHFEHVFSLENDRVGSARRKYMARAEPWTITIS